MPTRSRAGTWATEPATTSPRYTGCWWTTAGSTGWARKWNPAGTGSTTCSSPPRACAPTSGGRMGLDSFNKRSRPELFRQLSGEPLDLLVIGGGITGASVFRDAALRGMRGGPVEAKDLASATSGGSPQLIHRGPRYPNNMGLRRSE